MKDTTIDKIKLLKDYLELRTTDEAVELIEEGDYIILTDIEANMAWEEHLDNYIEEVIIPELPEYYRSYFDEEKWKRDAKHDGRGHCLAAYDGEENEVAIDGTYYYLYRQN